MLSSMGQSNGNELHYCVDQDIELWLFKLQNPPIRLLLGADCEALQGAHI